MIMVYNGNCYKERNSVKCDLLGKIVEGKLEKALEEVTFELRPGRKQPAVLKGEKHFREKEIALHG